jgi:hypothetical protein
MFNILSPHIGNTVRPWSILSIDSSLLPGSISILRRCSIRGCISLGVYSCVDSHASKSGLSWQRDKISACPAHFLMNGDGMDHASYPAHNGKDAHTVTSW